MKRGLDRASAHGRGQRRGGAPKGERVPLNARPRPKREQVATSDRVARPHGTVAPFRRSASPYFFGGKRLVALVGKPRAQVRRENEIACFTLPWRGRVAHRRCAGGGARRWREAERGARGPPPIPP